MMARWLEILMEICRTLLKEKEKESIVDTFEEFENRG